MKCLQNAIASLALLLSLSACNLTFNEVLGTTASAGAALVTTSFGLPPVVTLAASSTAGIATGLITSEPESSVSIVEVQNEFQADVAKKQLWVELVENLWHWLVGGIVGLIVIAWIIPGPQSIFSRKK